MGLLEWYLRFPAFCQGTLVCFVWNVAVAPYTYVVQLKGNQRLRREFLAYATHFCQLNLHLSVLPMAIVHTLPDSGKFQPIELWHGLVIFSVYMLLYVLVLDRMGMHLYPFLSARSSSSVIIWVALKALCCGVFYGVNSQLQ